MRILLINLLLLFSIVGAQAQSQTAERWFRPVQTGKEEYKDVTFNGDTIRFFKGEWVETVAKGNERVIWDGGIIEDKTLASGYKQRSNEEVHYPINLTCTAVFDTVKVCHEVNDTISCVVINQSLNKIITRDFRIPGEIVIPSLDSTMVLRFAPEGHASVTMKVTSIAGYGVPVIVSAPEPEPEPKSIPWLYIIIGASVFLIGGVITFVIIWIKRKNGTPAGEAGNTTPDTVPSSSHEPEKDSSKEISDDDLKRKVQTCESEIEGLKRSVERIKQEKTAVENELKAANETIASADARKEEAIRQLKTAHDKEVTNLTTQIESIKAQVESVRNKAREEQEAQLARFNEEKAHLDENIKELKENLAETSTELDETKVKLEHTESALESANETIADRDRSLTKFNAILSEVPYAKEYAGLVVKLMDLAEEVNTSALAMLDLDVADPYNLMKYISRYSKSVASLDMRTLNAELKMLEAGNMVLVGSPLATYNRNNSEEDLRMSTCQYFFTSYLQKMVDALVVLNESMAGADRLVDGVVKDDVLVFMTYRERIQKICDELGIVVENVRLFDKVGEKIDLSAQLVDIGFATGDIVDMENALVYLNGSHRPEVKVKVKVQE